MDKFNESDVMFVREMIKMNAKCIEMCVKEYHMGMDESIKAMALDMFSYEKKMNVAMRAWLASNKVSEEINITDMPTMDM
jgi:uncharacterized protein (DUF305 family)